MSPRLSFALLWALMLHLSLVLFLVAAPDPHPQGANGEGAGVELRLGAVAAEPIETLPEPRPQPPPREAAPEPEEPIPAPPESAPIAVEQSAPAAPLVPKVPVEAPRLEPPRSQPALRPEPKPAPEPPRRPPSEAQAVPPAQPQARAPGGNGGDRYLAQLRSHLARYRPAYTAHYGVAQLRFRIAANGAVSGVRVVESDGDEALAAEALALILRAEPMPVPPNGRPLELVVPIEFR